VGKTAISGVIQEGYETSDGQCGPTDGPQCPACKMVQNEMEMFYVVKSGFGQPFVKAREHFQEIITKCTQGKNTMSFRNEGQVGNTALKTIFMEFVEAAHESDVDMGDAQYQHIDRKKIEYNGMRSQSGHIIDITCEIVEAQLKRANQTKTTINISPPSSESIAGVKRLAIRSS
jgi:hypothetical protein